MPCLDTNVIVRLFIDEDPAQTRAAEHCLETYSLLDIADLALTESIYVLADYYDLGRQKAVELINMVISHPRINCNRALFSIALPLYIKHVALSIEDCCLATYAELNGSTPLLTFDRKLANQSTNTQLLKT
jgi:predicted nucleic-acid-binding protein